MKNWKHWAFVAVIAIVGIIMGFVACDNDNNKTTDNPVPDPTKLRLSGITVNIKDTPTLNNFGYFEAGTDVYKPLSDYITGTPKVEINDSKLTLVLDAPKESVMYAINIPYGNIVVNPSDAKWFFIALCTPDSAYYMGIENHDGTEVSLVYVDKDVNINGTSSAINYSNISLKRGWNFLEITSGSPNTYTKAAQTQPNSSIWTVIAY